MFEPQKLRIETVSISDDGMGGVFETCKLHAEVLGYIDLITGTDNDFNAQRAIVEQSTHVAIILNCRINITDKMRIKDTSGRIYLITYVDDPMNVHHHLEIYCRYGGEVK